MRFVLIDDGGSPEETSRLLEAACEARGVEFVPVDARAFDFDPDYGLADGDMLYNAGINGAAMLTEQALSHPGVATFHAAPFGAFASVTSQPLYLQHLGLPVPRTLPLVDADRTRLREAAARLGGLPLVVKVAGGSRGIGVMRVDSLAGLFSLADLMVSEGRGAWLSAYVSPATHWRVTVVGDRAVAAYRNIQEDDDFRTFGSEAPEDFTDRPPPELAALAVATVNAFRLEFGGVDILEHESGRLYVLESNFPCYFAQAQEVAGIDVAGAMIEHLLGKARAILAGS